MDVAIKRINFLTLKKAIIKMNDLQKYQQITSYITIIFQEMTAASTPKMYKIIGF